MADHEADNPGHGFPPPGYPLPDPTPITTANLQREIAALEKSINIRLDAMDRAQKLFEENLTRVPTEVDKQVMHLKTLMEEKFRGVDVRLVERQMRTEQGKRDSEIALSAALEAQKESVKAQQEASDRAIAKAEAATARQMEQFGALFTTATAGIEGKIGDLKDRLTAIESTKVGQIEARATTQGTQTHWVGILGLVLAGLIAITSLIVSLTTPRVVVSPPPPLNGNNIMPGS